MNEIIKALWDVIYPIFQLLVITVGPILVGWIATRFASLLKISDEKARAEFEEKLRDALHKAAENALKLITARVIASGATNAEALRQILDVNRDKLVEYVASKNPEAVKYFNLSPHGILDIITSKVPDLFTGTPGQR